MPSKRKKKMSKKSEKRGEGRKRKVNVKTAVSRNFAFCACEWVKVANLYQQVLKPCTMLLHAGFY